MQDESQKKRLHEKSFDSMDNKDLRSDMGNSMNNNNNVGARSFASQATMMQAGKDSVRSKYFTVLIFWSNLDFFYQVWKTVQNEKGPSRIKAKLS